MIVSDIKELIGKTPVFQFSATDYGGQDQSRIYAKLEYLNPGGSVKDRLGYHLITEGIAAGRITKDTTVIEPTAGNTGIGLALAGLACGLEMIFVIPDTFSQEKQQLIQALGARIIHSPGHEGMQGAIEKAKLLAAQLPNSFLPLQFENQQNPAAYYRTLGPEIVQEIPGKIASFVAGVGSGGTFAGTGAYLKSIDSTIRLIAVEPEGSTLNGGPAHEHAIEGIGVEKRPVFFKNLMLDGIETISDSEGFYYTRLLAARYGLLVGSSSGAAFAAAIRESKRLPKGSRIVTIFPDSGDRYLSKNIYGQLKEASSWNFAQN